MASKLQKPINPSENEWRSLPRDGRVCQSSRQARPFGKADGFRPPASQTSLESVLSFLHAPRPLILSRSKTRSPIRGKRQHATHPSCNATTGRPPVQDGRAQIGNQFPPRPPLLDISSSAPISRLKSEKGGRKTSQSDPHRKEQLLRQVAIFPAPPSVFFFCDSQKTLRWGTNSTD